MGTHICTYIGMQGPALLIPRMAIPRMIMPLSATPPTALLHSSTPRKEPLFIATLYIGNWHLSTQSIAMPGTAEGDQGRRRSRASIACSACRLRRSRCMRSEGESCCQYCKIQNVPCVIAGDDGRKRQVSKVEVSALRQRLALLEETLIQQKPSAAASQLSQEANSRELEKEDDVIHVQRRPPAILPISPSRDCPPGSTLRETSRCRISSADNRSAKSSKSPERLSPASSEEIVNTIVNARGHWIHDGDSGQRCYFQPNSNAILNYSTMVRNSSSAAFQSDCVRVIQSIPLATQDHLGDVYWEKSNSILPVIDKDVFNEDKSNNGTSYYSPFLYLCILATGLAYSDKDRSDIKALSLDDESETMLMHELHRLAIHEVDRPAGIPSIQALVLLGRLECMNGRENAGWIFSSALLALSRVFGAD
ncbi:Fungal specific transcription factor domain-containing [Pyrenophora seminiperda CCB06]|uniref:Fungal specific transcription factor domain-containing n=1 Tax=Pyrenophora seminiperda CCB06 TaxID=1302712 RepID=A0A3M7M1H2_9PLEO|nr:Fungal specific transcription factor domain-containing [Pyrenophora seminiperda CCB06]